MLYLEDGMYSYGEMSFESHVSVPNIMLGLQDSMISSTSGFLFFIDWKFIVSTLSGSDFFDVWESFLFLPCFFLVVDLGAIKPKGLNRIA